MTFPRLTIFAVSSIGEVSVFAAEFVRATCALVQPARQKSETKKSAANLFDISNLIFQTLFGKL
jgi:hypothetical protein